MANKPKLGSELVEAARIDFEAPLKAQTVDADGFYTKDAPGFEGRSVITSKGEKGDANEAVIKALIDAGNLVARGRLKHQYPHSWRSKKPVIFRNTPQWFIAMDRPFAASSPSPLVGEGGEGAAAAPIPQGSRGGSTPSPALAPEGGEGQGGALATLRQASLAGISATQWVPASGENRIRGMIEAKPDWVVSRQRAWGVPITVFVSRETGEILRDERVNAAIGEAFEKEGADAWFGSADGARFLTPFGHDPAAFEKVNDVLDVWFDSGSTHAYVLEDAENFPGLAGTKRKVDGGRDTVMYLEGSDQHRGWFHSSLIESCGTRGRPPFDVVLTHGFTMDEKGQKMSKSLGNVVAPLKVIEQSGADILRLWVASVDYADDQRIGPEILKNLQEAYRKLRNTLRWMLGSLAHFAPGDAVAHADMPELERYMLHRLSEIGETIGRAYAEYDYKKVIATLSQFMNVELSAFYVDIRKDALYCEPRSSLKRKAALTCIDILCDAMLRWLAPVLAFTADEAWALFRPDGAKSVHLMPFPEMDPAWRDGALAARWALVREARSVVTGALEIERANKRVGSSLEAAPVVFVASQAMHAALEGLDFAEACITSGVEIREGEGPADAFRLPDVPGVAVVPARASGVKCARSWRYFDPATADPAYPDITPRDARAMRELAGELAMAGPEAAGA